MGRKIKTSVLTPWKLSETETISPVEVEKKKKKWIRKPEQENALTRMLPRHLLEEEKMWALKMNMLALPKYFLIPEHFMF